MKKLLLLLIIPFMFFFSCEQEGTHYRCSAGTQGMFPTPSGCVESENGEFETMKDCEAACEH